MKKTRGTRIWVVLSALLMVLTLIQPHQLLAAETGTKTIDIITFNDFHGALDEEEKGKNPGLLKFVSAIKAYKEASPNTIVVAAGDLYQGSAMSNLTYGEVVSAMLKEIGLTASAVGNHEFDWGIDHLKQWEQDGNFPFIAANIIDTRTQSAVKWAKPYIVVEKEGIKIAFIGLSTLDTPSSVLAENVKGYAFSNLKEVTQKWVDYLKSGKAPEGKADIVIALGHIGAVQNDIKDEKTGKVIKTEITGEAADSEIWQVKGLDAIISGHTHTYVSGYLGKVPIIQAGNNGRALGHLTIKVDKNHKVCEIKPELDLLYTRKENITPDAAAKKIYEKYQQLLGPKLNEVVGKTATGLTHTRQDKIGTSELGYWVCDIMRKAAQTQIGLNNEGGLRDSIPKGDITMGTLYKVMPFDNTLCKIQLSGKELKKVIENGVNNEEKGFWMEVAGLVVNYDLTKPFGSRVVSMYLEDGTPVTEEGIYTVATNNFMASNGDQFDFSGAMSNTDTFKPIRDIMVEALQKAGTVNSNFKQPFIAVKAEQQASVKKAA